jgi:soluble lytic murein transglycosylase
MAQIEYQSAYSQSTDPSIQAAALWGLAHTDMKAGNYAKALDEYNSLIANYPSSPHRAHAHFLRAQIMMELGRYTEAVEAYSSYLALRPDHLDYYTHERRGDAYSALDDYAKAINDYQLALNVPHIEDDTHLKIKLARAYEASGDSVTALGMYSSISETSSNDYIKAQMDLFSGQLLLTLGQTDQAYAIFLHSVDNYPLAYDSYSALVTLVEAGVSVDDLNRGLVDYFAGQYGYALDAFTRYATANPESDGTVYYYRALALRASGLYQEAVDAYSFFIENYSGNRYWQAAWEEKAYTLWDDLDQKQAAAQVFLDFSHATSVLDAIPQALLNAGRVYEDADMLETAALTWESIADTHPGSDAVPQALFWAGIARYRLGQYDNSLVTFQRSLLFSLTPEDQARSIFWSGKSQLMLGDHASAITSFQQAASLDPISYYGLRAQDLLFERSPFDPAPGYNLSVDLTMERASAETWLRVTFALPTDTDLASLGDLAQDARLIRGTEYWILDLPEEARIEFEALRTSLNEDPASSYRLGNYLLSLGLYRSAIYTMRQVLTIAGMDTQSETLAAPRYFNLIRYGLYYEDIIWSTAQQYRFDPFFIQSVMRQESLFDPNAGSSAGALGLMQIWPPTGQGLADQLGWPANYQTSDLFRPSVNTGLGIYFLASNRNAHDGDLYAALAQYNSSPGNAYHWKTLSGGDQDLFIEVIPASLETKDYICSIYEIYYMYRLLYGTIQ